MAVRKVNCLGGCLLKAIVTIVIIVVLVGGAVLWVANQTFEELGLADFELEGYSLRSLGLADVEVKDVFKMLKSLAKPSVEDIVDNPYDPIEDKSSADNTATTLGLPNEEGGDTPNYLLLLGEDPITTDEQMLASFSDCELAYIMDTMVEQAAENADEDVQTIKDMNASVEQVSITKDGAETTLEILLSVDISDLSDEVSLGLVPSTIYLNSINTLSANTNGELSTESSTIEINGMSGTLMETVLDALFGMVNENPADGEQPITYFNDAIGGVFCHVVGNLGQVGTADTVSGSNVVSGNIVLGENGISTHNISVITREETIE